MPNMQLIGWHCRICLISFWLDTLGLENGPSDNIFTLKLWTLISVTIILLVQIASEY
jgi:hypothetical protein